MGNKPISLRRAMPRWYFTHEQEHICKEDDCTDDVEDEILLR